MNTKSEINRLLIKPLKFGSTWRHKESNSLVTIGDVSDGEVEVCETFQGKSYGWWENVIVFQEFYVPDDGPQG